MFWAYAVESYVRSEEGVFGKCFYKLQKDGDKYMELKVIFFCHYTKQIELNINFISGVFVVKGENFTNWVDNEFPKLLGPTNDKSESGTCKVNDRDTDRTKEMGAVWLSINSNKTVLENHDLLNREIKKEIDLLSIQSETRNRKVKPEIEKRISDAELSFDIKLTDFMEVITGDFETKVNKYTSRIESKITGEMKHLASSK